MSRINNLNFKNIYPLLDKIKDQLKNSLSLEQAAQKLCDVLYQELEESLVLLRVFATVPFAELPDMNKKFVQMLADSKDISSYINDNLIVLSLLGTRGVNGNWNNREKSEGHTGIPLASSHFIEAIPMMSTLLKSLGGTLDWLDNKEMRVVPKNLGKLGNMFHVPHAKETLDSQKRHIIAAQDFVEEYNVKTVFGFGGVYLTRMTMFVIIFFTRDNIAERKAKLLMPVTSLIKSSTVDVIEKNLIFS